MRVAVIGGGIAGLAAAWDLVSGPEPAEVAVFEPGPLGGKIRTTPFGGRPVDEGPDAFIARVPDAVALCRQLGIDTELVAPAAGRALLWMGDRLRPLPDGLVLGAPARLWPTLRSGILSPLGLARAGLDVVLPRTRWPEDLSVADLISRRFGRQVASRLVDPLVGSIHAGDTAELSVQATAPQLAEAARRSRSLLLGLHRAPPSSGPMFLAPRAGMGRLVEALHEALVTAGVTVSPTAVQGVRRARAGGVEIEPGGVFDRAVIATPAAAAGRLLEGASPAATGGLAGIPSASVVLVTLGYPAGTFAPAEGVSGVLVPRGEGRLMTACSFGSAKWSHWSDPGHTVLRVSTGRRGDDRAFHLDDAGLVDRLQDELGAALGRPATPTEWRVSRWPDAFPQYLVGHLQRVARIEADLARDLPGVALAGAAYRGSGIPSCITSGRRAAAAVRGGDPGPGARADRRPLSPR